jgi:hypothetical protein
MSSSVPLVMGLARIDKVGHPHNRLNVWVVASEVKRNVNYRAVWSSPSGRRYGTSSSGYGSFGCGRRDAPGVGGVTLPLLSAMRSRSAGNGGVWAVYGARISHYLRDGLQTKPEIGSPARDLIPAAIRTGRSSSQLRPFAVRFSSLCLTIGITAGRPIRTRTVKYVSQTQSHGTIRTSPFFLSISKSRLGITCRVS